VARIGIMQTTPAEAARSDRGLPAIPQRVQNEFMQRCEAFRKSDDMHVPAVEVLATVNR
jgi:hypothetical protein